MAIRTATAAEVYSTYTGGNAVDVWDPVPDVVSMALAAAEEQLDIALWGAKLSFGHALLAAHYLALYGFAGGSGETGQVLSRDFGDISETYAQTNLVSGGAYGSTRYGRLFESLQATLFVGGVVG